MILNPYIFAPAASSDFIIWLGKDGVTETANSTLTKTRGTGVWDSGAYSEQQAASGNIKVECELISSAEQGIIGISNIVDAAADSSFSNLDYSIFAYNGTLYAVENAAVTNLGVTYNAGDKMSVEVNSGEVIYRKNGGASLRTVSSPTLNYPLCADCSIERHGGVLKNCTIVF